MRNSLSIFTVSKALFRSMATATVRSGWRFALKSWLICSIILMSAVVVEWLFLNPFSMAGRLDSATSAYKIILSVKRAFGDMILTDL